MQFRLSTLLLATLVVATSLNLGGGWWGILLAAYALSLVAALRGMQGESSWGWTMFFLFLSTAGYCLLVPALTEPRDSSRRGQCRNNLTQIGQGLLNYADMYGAFPPLAAPESSGGPPVSWRLRLLPCLDHKSLHSQYRFDEPWNGPSNGALASVGPRYFYQCPSSPESQTPGSVATNYLAVESPNSPWGKPPDGLRRAMVVETVGAGVAWLEPKDLPVVEVSEGVNAPKQGGFASGHVGAAQVLFSDGSVRFIPDTIPPRLLRKLLTEPVDDALLDEIESLRLAAEGRQWPGVRLLAWLASIALLLLHGLAADRRRRRGQ